MWPGPGPEKDSPPLCRQGVGTHRAWLFALRDGTAGCAGSSPCFRNVYERIRLIWGNSPDSGIFLQWPQVTCAKHGCGISKKRRLGLHKLTQQAGSLVLSLCWLIHICSVMPVSVTECGLNLQSRLGCGKPVQPSTLVTVLTGEDPESCLGWSTRAQTPGIRGCVNEASRFQERTRSALLLHQMMNL